MNRILIVFETVQGQTEKIVRVMEMKLRRMGFGVDYLRARDVPENLDLESYSGVIVGAPVHAGGYPRPLRKWVKTHARALEKKPTAFFSVCLGVLQKSNEAVQKDERDIVRRFFSSTHWSPKKSAIFAGGLAYSRYNWFLRYYMRRIARLAGGDTDTSQDYEYTSWEEVRRFTRDFATECVHNDSVPAGM